MDRPYVKVGKIGYLANKTLPISWFPAMPLLTLGYIFAFFFFFEDAQ